VVIRLMILKMIMVKLLFEDIMMVVRFEEGIVPRIVLELKMGLG